MEVSPDNVHPVRISWETLQLLKRAGFQEHVRHEWEPFREGLSALTHLVFSSILFPFDFSPGEVEPGSATQGWRDPFLTAFFHLFCHHMHGYS